MLDKSVHVRSVSLLVCLVMLLTAALSGSVAAAASPAAALPDSADRPLLRGIAAVSAG